MDDVMYKGLRNKDFKLGQLHGKLQAENRRSEAHIQRTVFLNQKIRLWLKRNKTITIRIFGYEIPLQANKPRGYCVDLMGYDKDNNLYLIELKKKESGERIPKIVDQINSYESMIKQILPFIEKEFKTEYFLPIKFKKNIKKMILAPREFYIQGKKEFKNNDLYFAYFRDRDISTRKPGKAINLSMVKK